MLFWAAVPCFFVLIEALGFAWWQSALAFWVFFGVWGGLIERWSRRYLAGRRPMCGPALADERSAALAAPARSEEAQLVGPAAPASAPRVPTMEDWNEFYERVFGRLAGVASVASDLVFFLLFFHPGWASKLVAVLLMIASFVIVRGCTRRWRGASLPPGAPVASPAQLSAGASATGDVTRPAEGGTRRAARDPRARAPRRCSPF
ncbi:hypothetical protein [Nannocystis exedens]|uniref:hypothetical protein n=1 Tax=Nannocystis exedens TaxID=54 RepID=UPI000BBA01D3|nr:hypothetical protein [Nannocystis exedens]